MNTAEQPAESKEVGQADTGKNGSLLKDEEFFGLFIEEAIRQGVRLDQEEDIVALLTRFQEGIGGARKREANISDVVQVALDMVKFRELPPMPAVHPPAKAPIPREEPISVKTQSPGEKILERLGWNGSDPATRKKLKALIDRVEEAGIEEPDSYLSIREAGQKSGVAERTLRRYIAEGVLPTEKIRGPRGPEHRVYVPQLFAVLQERSGAFERARTSPIEEMGREISSLCRVIVEQQTIADRRTDRLLDELRNQSRVIDELRAEQRDARGQMHMLQEQMIKALMPRPKASLWERMFQRS